MFRIRFDSGEVQEVRGGARFLEICDADGALAAMVYRTADGRIRYTEAGDEDFFNYCEMFGVEAVKKKIRR